MSIFNRRKWKEEFILEAVEHPKEVALGLAGAIGAALLYLSLPDSVQEYISEWLDR